MAKKNSLKFGFEYTRIFPFLLQAMGQRTEQGPKVPVV